MSRHGRWLACSSFATHAPQHEFLGRGHECNILGGYDCQLEPGVVFDLVCMAVEPDVYLPATFSGQPILKAAPARVSRRLRCCSFLLEGRGA